MGPGQVKQGANRNDPCRIDVVVREVIVALDMVEIDRRGDSRLLVEVQKVSLEVGVVRDAAQVALEVPIIDGVKANERAEEPPVGLDDPAAEKVP